MMGGPEVAPHTPKGSSTVSHPSIVEPALSGVDSSDPSAS